MSVKQPPIELPLAESSEQPASAGLRMTYEESENTPGRGKYAYSIVG